MNNRYKIIYLLVGIFALVAVHIYLSFSGVAKLSNRDTVFDRSMLDADFVSIERGNGSDIELKRDDAGWSLDKPYDAIAENAIIEEMLDLLTVRKIREADIFSRKKLASMGKYLSDFGLEKPDITLHVSNGAETNTLYIGNRSPTKEKVFAMIDGDDSVYLLDSRISDIAAASCDEFRSRKLAIRKSVPVTRFDVKRPDGALLRLQKTEGQWMRCIDDETGLYAPASNVQINEFLSCFEKAGVRDFIWPTDADGSGEVLSVSLNRLAEYGLSAESGIAITIYDTGSSSSQMVLGRSAGDGLVYALVQNARAIVTVDARLKDLINAGDFSDSRLFPYDSSRISRIALTDGGVDYRLSKGNDGKWMMDSPIAAAADAHSVTRLLDRIVMLTGKDRDEKGVSVSISTNSPVETVSRDALYADFSLADLRSREIVKFNTSDIRRIESSGESGGTAVVYDINNRIWAPDASCAGCSVRQDAVVNVLNRLNSLNAVSIATLKASTAELQKYGIDFEKPFAKISVDFFNESSLRRNIFIGERTSTGYYAATGVFDAVFVLSDEDVACLVAPLVISEKGIK